MEEIKQSILPNINLDSTKKVALSPFTWNNIKLPTFPKPQRPQPPQPPLKKIPQLPKKLPNRLKVTHQPITHVTQKQLSFYKKSKSIREEASILTQQLQGTAKKERYKRRGDKERLNRTIDVRNMKQVEGGRSKQEGEGQNKRIRFLDERNNMEQYMKMNLAKAGWRGDRCVSQHDAQLLWANIDRSNDYRQLKKGQFYNHLNGSHHLTAKDQLHLQLSPRGFPFYPQSFLIPNEYSEFAKENNYIAALSMLKIISRQIEQYLKSQGQDGLVDMCLTEILVSSILKIGGQESGWLVKLCMFVDQIRKERGYNLYFEGMQNFEPIDLSYKPNYYYPLLQMALNYLHRESTKYIDFSIADIDYRLLMLILHYNRLFLQYESSYALEHHLWIVKPIASSRGAGVTVVHSGREFCINGESGWNQFKNRKKYDNKIIQKCIDPYLLPSPHAFQGRKFDIRQWVLVISDHNRPIIYRYHTAYCRFAALTYAPHLLQREVQLTNYSIFKQAETSTQSTLMIEDLFRSSRQDLRGKYVQQVDQIIRETVLSCSNIKYQEGCFELFGFDLLVDNSGKIYLLQVNLNPACSADRLPELKQQAETMTKTMISLVTEGTKSDKWVAVFGEKPEHTLLTDDSKLEDGLQIKPYYQYELNEDESIIAMVRNRNRLLNKMGHLLNYYVHRVAFQKIRSDKEVKKEDFVGECLIKFIEEKSTSNL